MTQVRSQNEGTITEIIDLNDPEFISVDDYIRNKGKFSLIKDWTRDQAHFSFHGVPVSELVEVERKKFFSEQVQLFAANSPEILTQLADKVLGQEAKHESLTELIQALYQYYFPEDDRPHLEGTEITKLITDNPELFGPLNPAHEELAQIFNATTYFFNGSAAEKDLIERFEKIIKEHLLKNISQEEQAAYLKYFYKFAHQAGFLYAIYACHYKYCNKNEIDGITYHIMNDSRESYMDFALTPQGIEVVEKSHIFKLMAMTESGALTAFPPIPDLTAPQKDLPLVTAELKQLISLIPQPGKQDKYTATIKIMSARDIVYNRYAAEILLGNYGKDRSVVSILDNFIEQDYSASANKSDTVNAWRLAQESIYLNDKSLGELLLINKKALLDSFLNTREKKVSQKRKTVFAKLFTAIMGADVTVDNASLKEFFAGYQAEERSIYEFGLGDKAVAAELDAVLQDIILYFSEESETHSPIKILEIIFKKNLLQELDIAKQNLYIDYLFRYAHDAGFFNVLYYSHQQSLAASHYRLKTDDSATRMSFSLVDGRLDFVESTPITELTGNRQTPNLALGPIEQVAIQGKQTDHPRLVHAPRKVPLAETEIKFTFPIINNKVVSQIEYARDYFHNDHAQGLLIPKELNLYWKDTLKKLKKFADDHLAGKDTRKLTKEIWTGYPEISHYHYPAHVSSQADKILMYLHYHYPEYIEQLRKDLIAHTKVTSDPVFDIVQMVNGLKWFMMLNQQNVVQQILYPLMGKLDKSELDEKIFIKAAEVLEVKRFLDIYKNQAENNSRFLTQTDHVLANIPAVTKIKTPSGKGAFFGAAASDKIFIYIVKVHPQLIEAELAAINNHYEGGNFVSKKPYVNMFKLFDKIGKLEQAKDIVTTHMPGQTLAEITTLFNARDFSTLFDQSAIMLLKKQLPAPVKSRQQEEKPVFEEDKKVNGRVDEHEAAIPRSPKF